MFVKHEPQGWTLKPATVDKCTNNLCLRIDLAQKNCICDVISLVIYIHYDVIKAPSFAFLICLLFLKFLFNEFWFNQPFSALKHFIE